jgi:hypothetical protein
MNCVTCQRKLPGLKPPAKYGPEHIGYKAELNKRWVEKVRHGFPPVMVIVAVEPVKRIVALQSAWNNLLWVPNSAIKRLY